MSQPTFKTKHYLATMYEDGIIVQAIGEADCTPKQAARELRRIADWLENFKSGELHTQ